MRLHGTRSKYQVGCRCLPCRAANAEYAKAGEKRRAAGEYRPLVKAHNAREHLLALSKKGIGYYSVAVSSGVAKSTLWGILSGVRQRISQSVSDRILAVGKEARRDKCLVGIGQTRRLIGFLVESGYSKSQLAAWLGLKQKGLHFLRRERITARTAAAVEQLYERIEQGEMQRM